MELKKKLPLLQTISCKVKVVTRCAALRSSANHSCCCLFTISACVQAVFLCFPVKTYWTPICLFRAQSTCTLCALKCRKTQNVKCRKKKEQLWNAEKRRNATQREKRIAPWANSVDPTVFSVGVWCVPRLKLRQFESNISRIFCRRKQTCEQIWSEIGLGEGTPPRGRGRSSSRNRVGHKRGAKPAVEFTPGEEQTKEGTKFRCFVGDGQFFFWGGGRPMDPTHRKCICGGDSPPTDPLHCHGVHFFWTFLLKDCVFELFFQRNHCSWTYFLFKELLLNSFFFSKKRNIQWSEVDLPKCWQTRLVSPLSLSLHSAVHHPLGSGPTGPRHKLKVMHYSHREVPNLTNERLHS